MWPKCCEVLRNFSRQAFSLLVISAAISGMGQPEAWAAGPPVESLEELVERQLVVLFDLTNSSSPSAVAIVNAVSHPNQNAELHGLLGRPISAYKVIDGTPASTQEILAQTPELPRARLEQYLVLTYPTATAARNARTALAKDSRVISVQQHILFAPLAVPGDTHYSMNPSQPDTANYQWGMQLLNMPAAWDKIRGNAYLAAIDYGLRCPPDTTPCIPHPDLQQNFRFHFSADFRATSGTEATTDNYLDEEIYYFNWPPQWINAPLRGHGTHVSGIIAATPQFGIFGNPNQDTGVAGVCWTCSFAMLKSPNLAGVELVKALTHAVDHGIQAVNMSFGDMKLTCDTVDEGQFSWSLMCEALRNARYADMVVVGAAGNGFVEKIQFPANTSDVIAVGGVQAGGVIWREGYGNGNTCTAGDAGAECGSNYGDGIAVFAPAMNVISTMYPNTDHNPLSHCGATADFTIPSAGQNGYGDCSGTSMAAPHITGIVGLLRSANPILTRDDIKKILTTNVTPCTGIDSEKCKTAGIPDASRAVSAALGGSNVINRLTPLFSHYSYYTKQVGEAEAEMADHFYTTVPQMALSSVKGLLIPQAENVQTWFQPIGPTVPNYAQFPTPPCPPSPCIVYPTPRAMLSVFTTHVNPIVGGLELLPLYRYSWRGADRTSHVYATDRGETWANWGYTFDGIEGYIFPSSQPQPRGAVKVCRKYDSVRDDYILFPGVGTDGADCSGTTDGYTDGNYGPVPDSPDWIGWAYTARSSQPVCKNMGPCSIIPILMLLLLDD